MRLSTLAGPKLNDLSSFITFAFIAGLIPSALAMPMHPNHASEASHPSSYRAPIERMTSTEQGQGSAHHWMNSFSSSTDFSKSIPPGFQQKGFSYFKGSPQKFLNGVDFMHVQPERYAQQRPAMPLPKVEALKSEDSILGPAKNVNHFKRPEIANHPKPPHHGKMGNRFFHSEVADGKVDDWRPKVATKPVRITPSAIRIVQSSFSALSNGEAEASRSPSPILPSNAYFKGERQQYIGSKDILSEESIDGIPKISEGRSSHRMTSKAAQEGGKTRTRKRGSKNKNSYNKQGGDTQGTSLKQMEEANSPKGIEVMSDRGKQMMLNKEKGESASVQDGKTRQRRDAEEIFNKYMKVEENRADLRKAIKAKKAQREGRGEFSSILEKAPTDRIYGIKKEVILDKALKSILEAKRKHAKDANEDSGSSTSEGYSSSSESDTSDYERYIKTLPSSQVSRDLYSNKDLLNTLATQRKEHESALKWLEGLRDDSTNTRMSGLLKQDHPVARPKESDNKATAEIRMTTFRFKHPAVPGPSTSS